MRTEPNRIDQAITPAGFTSGAVAYSLFIADHGLYMIKTGHGWRMNINGGRYRNKRMVDDLRRVEAVLDPTNLAAELAARSGSVFIPGGTLSNVTLGSHLGGPLNLRFTGDERRYRVQFDDHHRAADHHRAEVEAFVTALRATSSPGDTS